MPKNKKGGQGNKSAYSKNQQDMAKHIEKSYEDKGSSKEHAERIAWSTVNKRTGGAEDSPSSIKSGKDSTSSKNKSHSESHHKGKP
jgi:hypothetical protein